MQTIKVLLITLSIFFFPLSWAEFVPPEYITNSTADKEQAIENAKSANEQEAINADGSINGSALFGGGNVGKPFLDAIIDLNQVLFESIGNVAFAAGMALFAAFVGIYFIVLGAKAKLMGGLAMVFGDVLEFTFKALIPFTILTYNGQFNDIVMNGAFGFASDFMGLGGSSGAGSLQDFPLDQLVFAPVNNFNTMMGTGFLLFHNIPMTTGGNVVTQIANFNVINFLYAVMVLIFTFFLGMVYLITTFMVVAQLIAAMVILPIALALAPLFSVFIIAWIFSGIFTSWLSFLMLGIFAMMVGGIFVRVFIEFSSMISADKYKIVAITPTSNAAVPDIEFLWLNIAALVLYSMVMFYLAKQVWSIATQLSGGFRLNTGTFGDNGGRGTGSSSGGRGSSKGGESSVSGALSNAFKSPMGAAALPLTAGKQAMSALASAAPALAGGASAVAGRLGSGAMGAANIARDTIKSGGNNFSDYAGSAVDAVKGAGTATSGAVKSGYKSAAGKVDQAGQATKQWWQSGKY
jgi:hypothetical protein